jgi:hypothetical protein
MQLPNLSNVVLPFWAKYVAGAVLVVAVFSFGYVKGIERVYDKQQVGETKIIVKQGKVTTRIITKYIKEKEKQNPKDEEIKHEGQSYAIKFPADDYHFNNWYVRLHDSSITGSLSTLSSGSDADPSGVSVARQLEVAINNNIAGRQWKERALTCEEWALEQEEVK